MNSTIINLKDDIKEEQTEIKEVIKDLANSQKLMANSQMQLALSMTEIKSGISTLVKAIPIIFTIIGGFWVYNTFVLDRTDHSQTVQVIKK
jgi:ABC-type antimicrobial peptide transport system permease subunit